MTVAPSIETDRLNLWPQRRADFEAYGEFYASERARLMGGPLDRTWSWYAFAADAGNWSLLGFGGLTIEDRASGTALGQVALNLPPHSPERELGWLVFAPAEGKGVAFEAARAMRDYPYATLGWTTCVSFISPDNVRSLALAQRLGAVYDPHAESIHEERVVFRHPAPKVRA